MRILALDTASACGSVAVGDGERLLAEILMGRQETHSRHLMQLVDRALHMAGLALHEIDGFGITVGPGSFTGLRIGLSTLKGLAAVTAKPLAAISSLEALALQCSSAEGDICSMLDARNQEVYVGRYRLADGLPRAVAPETAAAPETILAGLQETVCLFVGDGALRYRAMIEAAMGPRAAFALPFQNVIRASSVWYLSRMKFASGQAVDASDLVPKYLRRSYVKPQKTHESV